MYRILRSIEGREWGKPILRGSLDELSHLSGSTIDKLLRAGLIARIASPPLSEIPGWSVRAAKLAPHGITTAEQFLEAKEADLAKFLKRPSAQIVEWKDQLRAELTVKPRRG